MTTMTKAQELFAAYCKYKQLEAGDLWNFLCSLFDESVLDNYAFDPYDSSLELFMVGLGWEPNPEQLTKLAEFGFQRLYVNYTDHGARVYHNLPSSDWGTCTNNNGHRSI